MGKASRLDESKERNRANESNVWALKRGNRANEPNVPASE
jgi:hypothetical protein